MRETGRIMALDVGNRRIGVAVTDLLWIIARPLAVVVRSSVKADLAAIGELAAEWDVCRLVVGHPLLPSGDRGEQALAVEAFVARLTATVSVPIELWDESYTTVTAERRRRERRAASGRRPTRLDAEAAAVILEEWLRSQETGHSRVPGASGTWTVERDGEQTVQDDAHE